MKFKHSYRIILLILFGISLHTTAKAQQQDSLVCYDDLTFITTYEKQLFLRLLKNQELNSFMPFFIASSIKADANFEQKIETTLEELKTEVQKVYNDKNPTKNIEKIHNLTHQKLFKKYELENSFVSIFENGHFNCVSGSAIFGLLLQKLNIPFVLKEKPDHVYLVAYPETHKILLESTDASVGYISYNEEFVRNYLSHLVKTKMITQEEVEKGNSKELFDKYYFEDNDITLRQLAGLQYANFGLYALSKQKGEEAISNFSKAYLLYPSQRITYLLEQAILLSLSKTKYSSLNDVKMYKWLLRFYNKEITNTTTEILADEFKRITHLQLITNSDFELYEQSYQLLKTQIQDTTTLCKEIDFVYHYENARVRLMVGKYEQAEPYLSKAYMLNPKNSDTRAMLNSLIIKKIAKSSANENGVEEIKKYITLYPFLAENEDVNTILFGTYTNSIYKAFANKEAAKGEKLMTEFETLTSEKTLPSNFDDYVARAYSEAAFFYFRKGNTSKAKQILQRGLKIAPTSVILKQRASQIK